MGGIISLGVAVTQFPAVPTVCSVSYTHLFFDYLEGSFITQEEVLDAMGRVAPLSKKIGRAHV